MASDKNKTEKNVVENLDSHLTSAGRKLANNKKIIYICVGVIAVAAAFFLSYQFIYRNPRLNNSQAEFMKVYAMQQRDYAQLGQQMGVTPEKIDSLNKAYAQQYQKVSENFSGTPAGNIAAFAAAEAYYEVKNYDAAIKLLEKLDLSEPTLMAQSRVLLGDCYVNTDKFDKAVETYNKAIKLADGNPELVPNILIKEANVYNAQNKFDKALDCYEQIKNNYPKYTFDNGNSIDFYIEREKAMIEAK